jgi:peptidoglycan hydrolase-like protein with peptidoglycan-binding domain
MKREYIIIILVLALLAVVAYFIMRSNKNEKESTDSIKEPEPFPLKHGSKGPEVGQLQKYLIKEFGAQVSPTGKVDSWWHDMTESAVNKFLQRDNVSASMYYKFKMDKY